MVYTDTQIHTLDHNGFTSLNPVISHSISNRFPCFNLLENLPSWGRSNCPINCARSHWCLFPKCSIIIPHATSCGGYYVFDPYISESVSQSVSPVFLASATPLKPLNRISWNFVDMKDIMCRWAYPQEILIPLFSRSYALFEFRNLAKMKHTTQHSLLAQLLWNRSTEFPETL